MYLIQDQSQWSSIVVCFEFQRLINHKHGSFLISEEFLYIITCICEKTRYFKCKKEEILNTRVSTPHSGPVSQKDIISVF